MRVNKVKQALKEGKLQLGCSVSMIRSPEITRILAAAGLDWTYLDSEHGGFDLETLQDLARAANDNGLCPIVRVAELTYALVARALDCGAQGILFPRVESPEVLAQAISWTRFPPAGVRGFGLQPTHLNYEVQSMPDVIAHMNDNVMVVLQIETVTAMNRVDELLSVPGVDAVMVGPRGSIRFARRPRAIRASHDDRGDRKNPRCVLAAWRGAGHSRALLKARYVLARSGSHVPQLQ